MINFLLGIVATIVIAWICYMIMIFGNDNTFGPGP